MTGALVFSGGGLPGIAWETGILAGISGADPRVYEGLTAPQVTYLGTSAGATVASQLASGTSIDELYAQQVSDTTSEIFPNIDGESFQNKFASIAAGATSPEDFRQRIGTWALGADTVAAADRLAVIAARLPMPTWSERNVLITAIDASTGELHVFDRHSQVDLIDAVAASCAVPGMWPTVDIHGRQYMDGGMRSGSNVDIVAGSDPVLILMPSAPQGPMGALVAQSDLDALGDVAVTIVYADDESLATFATNALDPAVRRPAAEAGRVQGRRLAASLHSIWVKRTE